MGQKLSLQQLQTTIKATTGASTQHHPQRQANLQTGKKPRTSGVSIENHARTVPLKCSRLVITLHKTVHSHPYIPIKNVWNPTTQVSLTRLSIYSALNLLLEVKSGRMLLRSCGREVPKMAPGQKANPAHVYHLKQLSFTHPSRH